MLLRYVHDVPALCRCSAVCKDWRSALTNVELGRFADVWEHVYRSSWKEIPDIREKKWNLREEAIRVHCLAHHELQDEEFTQVDLTKRGPSTQKYAVIHVECVCAALGGTVVVAAGSGRTLKKRGHDVALAVVLKEGDGQKLGTLLHSEDHDCIDSVVEIAHGHVATSVCSRDLVGIGSTIKIWDLRGEKNCVVQVCKPRCALLCQSPAHMIQRRSFHLAETTVGRRHARLEAGLLRRAMTAASTCSLWCLVSSSTHSLDALCDARC